MFFLLERTDTLKLHPKFFGKNLERAILEELKRSVEGKCSGRYGYTILVTHLLTWGKGHLHEDTGHAHFNVTYSSLVFRPFRNEVLSAQVTSVNKTGFFCQAGPCQIFVSKFLMPEDLTYNESGAPQFLSEDLRIEENSLVRVRIVSTRIAKDEISVIGTIKDDYLGPFEYYEGDKDEEEDNFNDGMIDNNVDNMMDNNDDNMMDSNDNDVIDEDNDLIDEDNDEDNNVKDEDNDMIDEGNDNDMLSNDNMIEDDDKDIHENNNNNTIDDKDMTNDKSDGVRVKSEEFDVEMT